MSNIKNGDWQLSPLEVGEDNSKQEQKRNKHFKAIDMYDQTKRLLHGF